jgi:hypothetical protein
MCCGMTSDRLSPAVVSSGKLIPPAAGRDFYRDDDALIFYLNCRGYVRIHGNEEGCRPALTNRDHQWRAAVLHPFFNPRPGGACRATGLSRGSFQGNRHEIARGPMDALCRHHHPSPRDLYIPFHDTTGGARERTVPPRIPDHPP